MSVGLSFLRLLLDTQETTFAIQDNGLSDEFFRDEETRILKFVRKFFKKYNRLPKFVTVANKFEEVDFPDDIDEPLEYFAEQIKIRKLSYDIKETTQKVFDSLREGDLEEARLQLSAMTSATIEVDNSRRMLDFHELSNEVLIDHDKKQQHEIEDSNVPFGFTSLDNNSGGIQAGETVALVGATGVGKSYILCSMANSAYNAANNVLFVSMEMSATQITRRILALRAKVNDSIIRKGMLDSRSGRRRVVEVIEDVDKRENRLSIIDGSFLLRTEELESYIKLVNPSVVYLDGAYLLKTKYSQKDLWGGVAVAAEQIKLMAASMGIPIIGTYQFNDKGDIYGGRSIGHLAGVVLHIVEDSMDGEGEVVCWDENQSRIINIVKGRFGEFGRIRISFNMAKAIIEELEQLPWKRNQDKKRRRRSR